MKVYVGADWSANELVCATADRPDNVRRIRSAAPTLESMKCLLGRVRERHPDCDEVHLIIEPGRRVWVRLAHQAGAIVHVVDPRQAKSFARSLSSSAAKDDKRDARTLALMGLSPAHCPPPWQPQDNDYQALQALETLREQLANTRVQAINRIRALLADTMPIVSRALPTFDRQWIHTFLHRFPTASHLSGLTRVDFDAVMDGTGVRKGTRERLWSAVIATQAPWLDPAVADVLAHSVRMLLDQLALVERQLHNAEERLDALTRKMPVREVLEGVDGIGLRQAASLIRFAFNGPLPDRDTAGVLLGASPVFVGSARNQKGQAKGHARLRRSAPAGARRTTYLLGRLASMHLRWGAAMYADGRARGQKPATVYRRIARSLLRILTACVRNGTPYDEDRYIAILKTKGVPWAAPL